MKIKGIAVHSINTFIKERFNSQYIKWMESLSEESREIHGKMIDPAQWYSIEKGLIEPTIKASELFFNSDHEQCAYEMGMHSAEIALKGVYKMFVMVSSPSFILKRLSVIWSSYYQDVKITAPKQESSAAVLRLEGLTGLNRLIAYRVAGWIDRAIVQTKKSVLKVGINKDQYQGNGPIDIDIQWV